MVEWRRYWPCALLRAGKEGNPVKTLYISDLDGTLLGRDDRLPPFTAETLNRLIGRGMRFTFATARSWHSAHKVAAGLSPGLPWIVHNGAFLVEGATGARRDGQFFTPGQRAEILAAAREQDIWPLVYAVLEGRERVMYMAEPGRPRHPGMEHYLQTRRDDPRLLPVTDPAEFFQGETYYFTLIDGQGPLAPLWERLGGLGWLNGTFQQELYRTEYWLELTAQGATKAQAALRLKEELGCDRLVAFGDAMNDLPLFAVADESYAVANAMEPVKAAATGVIGSNGEDGVARFLLANEEGRL